jgi:hypothetical protein
MNDGRCKHGVTEPQLSFGCSEVRLLRTTPYRRTLFGTLAGPVEVRKTTTEERGSISASSEYRLAVSTTCGAKSPLARLSRVVCVVTCGCRNADSPVILREMLDASFIR